METINLKEEVRNLIDKLPENFTWPDLISAVYLRQAMKSEPIQVKGIKQGKNILEDFNLLNINLDHLNAIVTMPFHHKDPFDRLLIAQAMVEGIPILSKDSAFDAYSINRIW